MTLRGSVEDTRTVLEVKLVNAGSIVYSAHRRRCLAKLSFAEFAFPAGASHHRDVMIKFGYNSVRLRHAFNIVSGVELSRSIWVMWWCG